MILDIVEIHEVGRIAVLIVVALCKVDMVYLLGQNYLLHNRSLHEAVRKFLEGFM